MTTLLGEDIRPGTKLFKDMDISDCAENRTKLPYYVIAGSQPGPTLCITSGVHGTEYPGIAANLKLYNTIDPARLKGTVIGCVMCNYEAFVRKQMFVNPIDRKNLNEVFPGSLSGTVTEVLAYVLLNRFVAGADFHIDMHSGDSIEYLFPYVFYHRNSAGRTDVDEQALRMAQAYGLTYIASTELQGRGASDRGNFYASVSEMGVPSIQPEIGGIGLADEKSIGLHYQGALNVMHSLGMLKPETVTACEDQIQLQRFLRLRASHSGVYYPRFDPGDRVKKGDTLAVVADFHGQKELERFTAEEDCVVLWRMAGLAAGCGDALMALGFTDGSTQ